jgi:radical SAM PhpK family P-methyltransferase
MRASKRRNAVYTSKVDCIVIGYNEIPFQRYESFLRNYGTDTEAYRDLQFSFVDLAGNKLDYVGLLNYVYSQAHPQADSNRFKSGDIPNLAAMYLTNFLRQRAVATEFINLFQYEKERLAELLSMNPVAVAITTTFYVVNLPVNEMVEFIRSHNKDVKIVVGGPLVSNHSRNFDGLALRATLNDMGADIYVNDGQGEHTLYSIVECLKSDGDLSKVPNIIYFDQGKMLRTDTSPENNSLDENYIDWTRFPGTPLGPTIQTRTARSCAFSCSFCNYPARAGKLTLASLDTFETELNSMKALGNVKNVVFIDDTFNVPIERFKEMCRLMIRKNYGFNWYSYFRCSNSDDEAIDLMVESGCKGVFLGIESGSATILKNMNKAATPEKYIAGMKRLHERGVLTFGSFIVGFPGETEETLQETIDFIKQTRPSYYRAQSWYCEPGTPVDRQREKYSIKGEGFVWQHATMDSQEAMDHIDRMFLDIRESQWLPQWSFDFWIIPYLQGMGIGVNEFREFMTGATDLLRLEIATVPPAEKRRMQEQLIKSMVSGASKWNGARPETLENKMYFQQS